MISKKLKRQKHSRSDGWLTELVSMAYDDEPFGCIHSYLVCIYPGSTRAMHYHNDKEEWLAITSGCIKIVLEDIKTKDREEVIVDSQSKDYSLLYVPPNIAHGIKNIGDEKASLVAFTTKPEQKGDTIKYEMEV